MPIDGGADVADFGRARHHLLGDFARPIDLAKRPEDQGQVGRYGNAEVLGKTKGKLAIALRIKDRERAFKRDQALRRSAFQEAISHLGKAIEMADKAGEGAPRATAVSSGQRLKLQTSYGQAMISARGYSAPEITAAFARARELTAGIEDAAERFSIYYGLWVGNFVRGELAPMRDIAEIIKREVEARPGSPEAGVAARVNSATDWYAGNFADVRVS